MVNVFRSTGNVFADLGFGSEASAHLKVRSDLMLDLRQFIENSDINQSQAAEIFGVTQPRVSDLVRGRIDLFSTDALIEMAARAGLMVRVSVEGRAGLTVSAPDLELEQVWEETQIAAQPEICTNAQKVEAPDTEELAQVAA